MNATVELRPDGFHLIVNGRTIATYYARHKAQLHADQINAGTDLYRLLNTSLTDAEFAAIIRNTMGRECRRGMADDH